MNTAKFLSAWLGFGIVLTLTIGGAGEGRSLAEAQDVFSFGGGTNGYEIHAADNGRDDLVWCIKETCRAMDDADPSPCGGWRMRVRSRLDSCGWTMGTAKFSVRLLASRTILLQFSENGFVESEKPEGERTFVLDGPGARACVPSGFLAVSMEMLRGGQPGAGITMCANGREFVHCEGVTAEYALFLIGNDVIAFSYRMGDAARPEIVKMPFRDAESEGLLVETGQWQSADSTGRYSLSVEEDEEGVNGSERFLSLKICRRAPLVCLLVSVKNIKALLACLKSRGQGLDCHWKADSSMFRSLLFF